jgi:hypothetical protein
VSVVACGRTRGLVMERQHVDLESPVYHAFSPAIDVLGW